MKANATLISLASALLTLSPAAGAGVYKCEVDGKIVFSDRPCSGGAEEQEVEIRYHQAGPEEAAIQGRDQYVERLWEQHEESKRQRAISAKEREIKRLERQRDERLAQLGAQKARAANNLAGASWELSISAEMQAVAEQYSSKIETARSELEAVRK